jgi:hypothetical protein
MIRDDLPKCSGGNNDMNGYELALHHAAETFFEKDVKGEMLFKELLFQRPDIKDIMVKLYRQCGRSREGRQVLVDKLRPLLHDDKIDSRM